MKKKKPVRLALLWHMHQPVYGLPGERELRLPWVRMHALRGYLWLARLAERYPQVRQTINLVPSLLAQVQLYEQGSTDTVERLARVEASRLTESDKRLVLEHFFSINPRHHILPYSRYRALLEGARRDNGRDALRNWREGDWRDLQTWFHLSSLDPISKREDPLVLRLLKQERGFGEGDKLALLDLYRQGLRDIVPVYRRLWEQGTIDLSTTPYYHPILPILCDAQIGRASNPSLPDYDLSFRWPGDAELQIERALEAMEAWFGRRPKGVWPSEGSVSEEVVRLLDRLGVKWCASDEAVLEKSWRSSGLAAGSLKRNRPHVLKGTNLSLFFRNHDLSDRLGFLYQNRGAEEAVDDFLKTVLEVASGDDNPVVSVILDGENPWEHYPSGGLAFLETLFGRLSDHPAIETVTFSQATQGTQPLPALSPGSWINGNFDIWIGDVQDRNAWRLIAKTRELFEQRREALDASICEQIQELLMRAEGSDWTWWYGSEHPTKDLLIFDGLLRDHLIEAYRLMGETAPFDLLQPVPGNGTPAMDPLLQPQTRFIEPKIDVRPLPFFDWVGAGRVEARSGGGAMHQVTGSPKEVQFGYSPAGALFLRIPVQEGEAEEPLVKVEQGEAQHQPQAADLSCKEGELIVRYIPKSAEPIRVRLGLAEQNWAFTLPPLDLREIQRHWMV